MKPNHVLTFLIALAMTSCSEFTYTKLDEFKFEKADIEDDAEIEILTFSGGKDCTPDITYYYSVIAIVAGTTDTVRVLTPCQLLSIKFPNGFFHSGKYPRDSLLQALAVASGTTEKYVVINSELPFQDGNYPVAIGSIGFKDDTNEILKDELKDKDIDTTLLESPKKEL